MRRGKASVEAHGLGKFLQRLVQFSERGKFQSAAVARKRDVRPQLSGLAIFRERFFVPPQRAEDIAEIVVRGCNRWNQFDDFAKRCFGVGQLALIFEDDGKRHIGVNVIGMVPLNLAAQVFRDGQSPGLIVDCGFLECGLDFGGVRRMGVHSPAISEGWCRQVYARVART